RPLQADLLPHAGPGGLDGRRGRPDGARGRGRLCDRGDEDAEHHPRRARRGVEGGQRQGRRQRGRRRGPGGVRLMAETIVPLANDFAPATREEWLKLVDKTLKGADLSSLTRRTDEGLEIQPLSQAGDAAAPALPIRGPREGERSWDVRV